MPRAIAILDGGVIRQDIASHPDLNQRKFALRIGMRPEDLSRALSGKPIPPTTVFKIAFGLSLLEPSQ